MISIKIFQGTVFKNNNKRSIPNYNIVTNIKIFLTLFIKALLPLDIILIAYSLSFKVVYPTH